MRLRRTLALYGSFIIFSICFILYLIIDLNVFPSHKTSIEQEFHDNKWLHFEGRLRQLEEDLNKHHEEVGEIKQAIKVLSIPPISNSNSATGKKLNDSFVSVRSPNIGKMSPSEILYNDNCSFQISTSPRIDVQMLDLYKKLKFDNPDGGVWKQGWKIQMDPLSWNKQHKLKVFVVPHSHNDPGWLKTVDEYYLSQTKHILNNMLVKLQDDRRRKFIWAEVSYLSMWWDDLDHEQREIVKRLVSNNQLEIVTGGWVMNDEANSHWISIMHQMTEGHQWLEANLNYTPISHWSIDPFGLSSTQPMLLKQMNLQNMLIQRVHYSVKKQLAFDTNLEFRWRQIWDNTGKTEIFTQVMPFYSYDIPHTCGPDPKICCQFDFKRLPGHGLQCPWKIAPQPITQANVAHKAEMLLDQYRKKSTLYKTNVLLVPLGDDFRYSHPTEWDVQYQNYQALFDFMNANLKMHVQIQFGTLTDYFNAVRTEKPLNNFPTLTGDFFTYSDRNDHYWSGYYTSRPFYKRMDRVLLSYIRSSEIILSLTYLNKQFKSKWLESSGASLNKAVTEARRALSLFQHHDGVTGTAKDDVVIDYGEKMLRAIKSAQNVIQHCTNLLLSKSNMNSDIFNVDVIHYNVDDIQNKHDSLPEKHIITIGPELSTKKIVIFNSLPHTRHEIVSFIVSTPFIEVKNFKNRRVKCQIAPIFEYGSTMSNSKYHVYFIVNVPALGVVTYTINALVESNVPRETVYSTVKIFNQYEEVQNPKGFKKIQVSPSASEFTIQNVRIVAAFNSLGLLKAVKVASHTIPVHLDFAKYGARYAAERSGAYLFLPDSEATPLHIENTIVKVIEGPLISSVTVQLPHVQHIVTLLNSPGADGLGLEIQNLVDIQKTSNFELVMRLSTNINSSNEYFTDSNGYQIHRRIRFSKLPLQANYYPMPTTAYIEDKFTRLSILTGSPLGCASLREGQLEVMLDRRLNQDDHLGLGQGVLDNHPTRHIFRILLERKTYKCAVTSDDHPSGFPTLSAHVASQSLLNPLVLMLKGDNDEYQMETLLAYSSVETDFGVDFTLPSLRTGVVIDNKNYIGMVVQRQHLNMCFADKILLEQFPLSDGTVNISAALPQSREKIELRKSSLSFLHIQEKVNTSISMCPMDIQAFILKR